MAEKDYFEDLLEQFDDPKKEEVQDTSEEEQRRKNKDAEEARKRREAEAKAKAEAEAQKQTEEKAQEPEAKVEQPIPVEEKDLKVKAENTNRLGEQLVQFKARYPEVELSTLDKDINFKKFINGKLLGKQNFIELYEDYIDLTSSISGTNQEELRKKYEIKAKASSGTSKPAGKAEVTPEIYTKEELDSLLRRIPLMGDRQVKQIQEKFDRSVEYYKKNK